MEKENKSILNLSGKGLKKFDLEKFQNVELEELTTVILSNNQLTDINESLFQSFSNLIELKLNNNRLTAIDEKSFKQLVNIEVLWLNNNLLTTLEPNLFEGLSNLKELKLNSNRIKTIEANSFKGLSKLEKLYLNNNELIEVDAILLHNLAHLKLLSLFCNKLSSIDANSFIELIDLQILYLNHNKLEWGSRELDGKVLNNLANLKELSLNSNKLMLIDANSFSGLTNLEKLSLDHNQLTVLSSNLFESLKNLKELRLNNNNLTVIELNVFEKLDNLVKLHLNNNELTEIYINSFLRLKNLKELSLFSNKLKKIDYNTFNGLENLEKLSLSNNEIEEVDSSAFEGLSNLKELGLCNNKIPRIDAHMLNKLTKLEILYLNNNNLKKIDPKLFRNLSRLNVLNLNSNKLKKIGIESFQHLKSIGVIQLYENDFKVLSYLKLSAVKSALYYDIKQLNKNRFYSDWNRFLQQFPRLDQFDRYENEIMPFGNDKSIEHFVTIDKNTNKKKVMKIIKYTNEKMDEDFEILININHTNILKYLDCFHHDLNYIEHTCVILEYCENGDLKGKIAKAKREKNRFSEEDIFKWIFQATNGLKYLHSDQVRIIHKNIKPENISLTKDNVVKLGNIAVTRMDKDSGYGETSNYDPYMSPELEKWTQDSKKVDANSDNGKVEPTFNTDVWSLGCVLFELVFLDKAFPKKTSKKKTFSNEQSDRFSKILSKTIEIDPKIRIDSNKLYELLENTWQLDT